MRGAPLRSGLHGRLCIGAKAINVVFLVAGDEDTASSRLRAYPLLARLTEAEEISSLDLASNEALEHSVIWIQKKLTEEHLLLAKYFKARGAVLIYDCDESGTALSCWAQPHLAFEMFHLADWIVADTPERVSWLKRSGSLAEYVILENQIDYGIPRDVAEDIKRMRDNRPIRVLWFGNSSNLAALASLAFFQQSGDYQVVLCGATVDDVRRYVAGCNPEVHPWDREGFLDLLATCDISVLSHGSSPSDLRKSGHKMVTSICHGVPVIASATPDYVRIARRAGVEDFLFNNSRDLDDLFERLKDINTRKRYISTAKPRLMERYRPGSFAENALSLINKAYGGRQHSLRIYQSLQRGQLSVVASRLLHLCGKSYWRMMQA